MTLAAADSHSDTPVDDRSAAATRYTRVAIVLHWTIAALIAFQLVGGAWMVRVGDAASALTFTVFQVHKTVGLSILALTLARLIWRLAHRTPDLPGGMTRAEQAAAKAVHVGFYGLMIVLPLTGWAMASVSPTDIPTFFLLLESLPFAHLPLLPDAGLDMRHALEAFFKEAHLVLSITMAALIALHVGAALKHQFIARDGLLNRMIPWSGARPASASRRAVGIVALLAATGFLALGLVWGIAQKTAGFPVVGGPVLPASQSAAAWQIDHSQSELGFTLTFTGNPVDGRIGTWTADIAFDPQALDEAQATVQIDMASIALANPTLQAQAGGGDGFDLAQHPLATYQTTGFSRLDEDRYRAEGILSLRGFQVPVPLTFDFREVDGVATVDGALTLNRLDFGIGAVGAADEAWLRHAVEVRFRLVASRGAATYGE